MEGADILHCVIAPVTAPATTVGLCVAAATSPLMIHCNLSTQSSSVKYRNFSSSSSVKNKNSYGKKGIFSCVNLYMAPSAFGLGRLYKSAEFVKGSI